MFCQEEAVFCQEEAVFCQEEAVFCQEEAVLCQEEVVFCQEEAVFCHCEKGLKGHWDSVGEFCLLEELLGSYLLQSGKVIENCENLIID